MKRPSFTPGLRTIIVLALAITGGAVLWHKVIRDHVIPRNFGAVEAGAIYRSGRLTENTLRTIHDEHNIRTIIDLGAYQPQSEEEQTEVRVADELGLVRHQYRLVGDGTGDPNQFIEAVRLMADSDTHPVLVHCAAGAQRTSTVVILYRHLVEGVPIHEAYPESFEFKHEPDNYHLLAYLADNIGAIRASWETGRPLVQDESGRWVLAPDSESEPEPAMDEADAVTAAE